MTDYIVANCETTAFNGTYIQVNPSYWEKSDGGNTYALYYESAFGCMMLQGSDGSAMYIDNNYGGELPPDDPSIDWYDLFTVTPSSLTVTAASSGTTHEGEVFLSSLSYLRTKKFPIRWWLAGGIDPANCVAAYQPKGAADYAASKVNLTGNTTYDAVEGSTVSWNATDGWVAGSSGYLKSGIIAVGNQWSMILRFTNGGAYGNSMYWGCMTSGKRWAANVNMGSFARCYIGNYADIAGGNITTGVYAFAGGDYYINGSYFGTVGNAINNTTDELYLLGYNTGGTPSPSSAGKFQAMAFYNTVLTPTQVGLLTTAMAAL